VTRWPCTPSRDALELEPRPRSPRAQFHRRNPCAADPAAHAGRLARSSCLRVARVFGRAVSRARYAARPRTCATVSTDATHHSCSAPACREKCARPNLWSSHLYCGQPKHTHLFLTVEGNPRQSVRRVRARMPPSSRARAARVRTRARRALLVWRGSERAEHGPCRAFPSSVVRRHRDPWHAFCV